jgi:hypothetical protein
MPWKNNRTLPNLAEPNNACTRYRRKSVAWIYESNRGRSAREVLEVTHQVFRQLLTVIEDLPDEVHIERIDPAYYLLWVDEKRFPVDEFFDHFYEDHEPDVRVRLARIEKQ